MATNFYIPNIYSDLGFPIKTNLLTYPDFHFLTMILTRCKELILVVC